MKNWMGKKLRDKDNPSDKGSNVVEQKDGWVHLENNQQVPENKVDTLFEEVKAPDPDDFFNSNNPTMLNLANEYKKVLSGEQTNESVNQAPPQQEEPIKNPYDTISAGVSSEPSDAKVLNEESRPLREDEKDLLRNAPKPPPKKPSVEEDEWVKANFEEEGEVRRVNTDEFNTDDYRPGYGNKKQAQNNHQSQPQRPAVNPVDASAPPMFTQMKKSHPIKIKLEIDEMIPKLESIKHLNDLFEYSIVDYLAKDITQKYVDDPKILEDLIREYLENLVNPKPKNKRTTRKTTTKKTTAKKTPTKKSTTTKNSGDKEEDKK